MCEAFQPLRGTVTDSHVRARLTSNILFHPNIFQIPFSVLSLFVFHQDCCHLSMPFQLQKFKNSTNISTSKIQAERFKF